MFSKIQMMAKNYKISSTLTLLLYCLVPMATGCGRIKEKTMVSPGDEIYVSLLLQPNTESEDLSKADDSAYIHQPNTESEDASKNTESVYIPPKPLHFMKNKRYRRYIDPVSDISPEAMDQPYLKIFQKTDSNSDGYITVDEYLENNPNMTNDDTRIVMEVYDKNRDSRVSQAEFLREGKPESRTEACDVMALHQCGMDFINIVQLARDDNEAVCIGLQTYVNCVSWQLGTSACTSNSFNGAVMEIVTSFKKVNICPLVDSIGLQLLIQETNRERRAVTSDEKQLSADCNTSDVMDCDVEFIRKLKENEDPCDSLFAYRRCIHRSTRKCHDAVSYKVREGIKHITRAYRNARLCTGE